MAFCMSRLYFSITFLCTVPTIVEMIVLYKSRQAQKVVYKTSPYIAGPVANSFDPLLCFHQLLSFDPFSFYSRRKCWNPLLHPSAPLRHPIPLTPAAMTNIIFQHTTRTEEPKYFFSTKISMKASATIVVGRRKRRRRRRKEMAWKRKKKSRGSVAKC